MSKKAIEELSAMGIETADPAKQSTGGEPAAKEPRSRQVSNTDKVENDLISNQDKELRLIERGVFRGTFKALLLWSLIAFVVGIFVTFVTGVN